MKQKISIITIATSLLFVAAAAYAAQDYNSSRSNNTTAPADTPKETERLIREVSTEALTVSRRMFEVDSRDGYTGDYAITVDISVRYERVASPVK